MLINHAPENTAVLSNVGQIGEFRIRNSAKAFSILSSGLYANKVKAIIRELSCNAVDSHTAAGNPAPFEVHLPNSLEPHFSIRDFGTGLSHDQVTNIYTTYFESTKTNSNDYIGALGLGSKSPFSYTDNFTVTAIQNGRKGVYTAFINGEGVPSIALMTEETTTEPSGVEIKFSVNERYDFEKFRSEARSVFAWFKVMPIVKGYEGFKVEPVEYKDKDIIPGVHYQGDSKRSVALMGNIAYPIHVPESDKTINDSLRKMLDCGLVIEFAIGELDFQASREGLSYIPHTIESINKKLIAITAELSKHITKEADQIENLWQRATYLMERSNSNLWKAAVEKYITDTNFELLEKTQYSYGRYSFKRLNLSLETLATQFNISLRGFSKDRHRTVCTALPVRTERDMTLLDSTGKPLTREVLPIDVGDGVYFVVNDTNVGALERAKYHWRKNGNKHKGYSDHVYIIEPVNKDKPVKLEDFYKFIYNPPNTMKASQLDKKERAAGMGKNVKILLLEERGTGGYYRKNDLVWRDAGDLASFDTTKTYYYIPLSGFVSEINYDTKQLKSDLKDGLGREVPMYGVRKGDIEQIKKMKNWISVEVYVKDIFAKLDTKLVDQFAMKALDKDHILLYNSTIAGLIKDSNSPYLKFTSRFKDVQSTKLSVHAFNRLSKVYGAGLTLDSKIQGIEDEAKMLHIRYPVISMISQHDMFRSPLAVAEYINLIDISKGV